jgi:hypothetical protein
VGRGSKPRVAPWPRGAPSCSRGSRAYRHRRRRRGRGWGCGAALACTRHRRWWPLASSQATVDPAPVAATGGEAEDGMRGCPHLCPSLPPLVAAGLLSGGHGSRAPSPPPPEERRGWGQGHPHLRPSPLVAAGLLLPKTAGRARRRRRPS